MLKKLAEWNTLRNQMLGGFLSVMIIVLLCAGFMTYHSVSNLLKEKAETQMRQTAHQAVGRLEAQLSQVDTLMRQAMNDRYLQQLLGAIDEGETVKFPERQSLMQLANEMQAYSSGVASVEVYTKQYQRLYPLDEQPLSESVPAEWIARADEAKGQLVWAGVDPAGAEYVLALRRISLVDRWFSSGGYLLVRLHRSYFAFAASSELEGQQERMLLVDAAARSIVAEEDDLGDLDVLLETDAQTVKMHEQSYMLVKQPFERTGWTLMMLYPENSITSGISILRLALMISGAVGFLLFILFSFLLSTMITRPILRLMRSMRNTRQGILTPNPETILSTAELNDLNATYNQMVDHINGLIKLVYEKEMLYSRTKLQALQAQINPHFLYNTLEAFYWSLQEKEEEELSELVIAMSDMFRYVISSSDQDEWVALGQELEQVERYLRLIGARLGSRLTWTISMDGTYPAIRIPKLLIQPLVENAILHGVEGKVGAGRISVRVDKVIGEADCLRILIEDDGPGMDPMQLQSLKVQLEERRDPENRSKRSGLGMGMMNVLSRLELYYADSKLHKRGLTVESETGKGTSVCIYIPMEEVPIHAVTQQSDSGRG